jgi:DnaJ-class molecular chaperone
MGKDFYSVLDIDPETDTEEIRQAYVNLARQYHPDVSKDVDAKKRFEEINLAYEVLSDEEKRVFYNLFFREAQDDSRYQKLLPWWDRNKLAMSISIMCFAIVIGAMSWLIAQF